MKHYTFFLNFKDDSNIVQIEEPFMFDAFSHAIEQKKNGWARDVNLFAENSELLFTNSYFSPTAHQIDIEGKNIFNLSHALKNIFDAYETFGPDANIEFQIFYKGTLLIACDLDLEDIDSDLETYFQCGCIENSTRAKHKRNEDDVIVDLYANKDIDGNPITPLVPKKILYKSKPFLQNSKWIKTDIPYSGAPNGVTNKFPAGGGYVRFNFCKNPILYGIADTLVPNPFGNNMSVATTYNGNGKIIDAKSTLTNSILTVTSDITQVHKYNGRMGYTNMTYLRLKARVSYGTGISDNTIYTLYDSTITSSNTQTVAVPPVITWNVPGTIRQGEFLTVWWEYFWTESTIALTADYNAIDNYSHIIFNDCTMEMSSVSTTINSVVEGVTWYEMKSKAAENISGLPVNSPRTAPGGEYENIYVLSGNGIRNISGKPFNVKTKKAFETGMMIALDYQVNNNIIEEGSYEDYFSNELLHTFTVKPDNKFKWNTNKDYRIKTFDFGFKKYEQDRDEQKTLDAIHTTSQWLLPNAKTNDPKKVEVEQIVDNYKIDSLRRLGINPETKDSSLEDDDSIIFIDTVPIDNGHTEFYTGKLYVSTTATGIKIVSTAFRWDKIGLSPLSQFQITTGSNAGHYSISLIESTVLTLTTISTTAGTLTENEVISIQYTIPDVQLMSRTDEGFAFIDGIIAPNKCGNLYISIKRNMEKWYSFLATCGMRYITKAIDNKYFKANDALVTRLNTETVNVVDKASIQIIDIADKKKVTDRVFSIDVFVRGPLDVPPIIKRMEQRNPDGTIGGFFRFKLPDGSFRDGYPYKFDYIVKEGKIEAECLEKYYDDFFDITTADLANYSGFELNGIYVTLKLTNLTELFTMKRFTKIKINGVLYSDITQFNNVLQTYFN